MKKLLFFFILISGFAFGQRLQYSEYFNSYENKNYKIFLTYRSPEKYTIYISLPSRDIMSDWVYVEVGSKNLDSFKKSILDAKIKFDEWNIISDKAEIKQVSNKMNIASQKYVYSFTYGDNLILTPARKLSFRYTINEKESNLELYEDLLVNLSNTYMRTRGFSLVFKNESDFDNLLSKLNSIAITEFINTDIKNKNLLN